MAELMYFGGRKMIKFTAMASFSVFFAASISLTTARRTMILGYAQKSRKIVHVNSRNTVCETANLINQQITTNK